MQKSFITATPDSGSGNGTVTCSASGNTGASRSTSIIVSGGGLTRTVSISQAAGIAKLTLYINTAAFSFYSAATYSGYIWLNNSRYNLITGDLISDSEWVAYTRNLTTDTTFNEISISFEAKDAVTGDFSIGTTQMGQDILGKRPFTNHIQEDGIDYLIRISGGSQNIFVTLWS